ncbi:MAG: hypothetical protein AB7F86_13695 [Bdellovibrionales bacterium]
MFKNETLVKLGICTLLAGPLSLNDFANAETSKTTGSNTRVELNQETNHCTPEGHKIVLGKIEKYRAALRLAERDLAKEKAKTSPDATIVKNLEEKKSYAQQDYDDALADGAATGCYNPDRVRTGVCEKERDKLRDTKAEANEACGAVPNPQKFSSSVEERENNIVSCGPAIEECGCSGAAASRPACRNRGRSGSQSDGLINTTHEGQRMAMCPVIATEDTDKYEKEASEIRNRLRELQRKIPELQKAAQEVESAADDKIDNIAQEQTNSINEYENQVKEAQRAHEEAQNQLGQQILSLQDEILKNEEGRGEIRRGRIEAEAALIKAKRDIRGNCHVQAITKVNAMVAQRMSEAGSNSYNRGGFNRVLQLTGLTDRQRWQQKAKEEYDECVRDAIAVNNMKNAEIDYDKQLKQADVQELAIDKRRWAILERIKKIRSGGACGSQQGGTKDNGESGLDSLCTAQRRMVDDANRARRAAERKMAGLAAKKKSADLAKIKRTGSANQTIAQAQFDIAQEEARLKNLEEFLDLKRRHSQGIKNEAGAFAKARGKYFAAKNAAVDLLRCQTRGGSDKYSNCTGDCETAALFLKAWGDGSIRQTAIDTVDAIEARNKVNGGSGPPGSPGGSKQQK